MANRFFVGTGTWDTTTTTNWSATSGGATGASAPTVADDVFLDASSTNVTINPTANCRSLNCTGYTGTLTIPGSCVLNIGDATAGASNIALRLVVGMTLTMGSQTTAPINFISTSATVQTVEFAGKTTGSVNFSGVGSSYNYTAGHSTGSTGTVTLNNGTLNTNGQTCSWGIFNSANSNTRTLTLGASVITLTGTATTWNVATTSGLTMTANTAIVTLNGAAATFNGGGKDFNGMSVVMSGSGAATVTTTPTLANFTRTGTAVKTDSLLVGGNIICTGAFTVNSNSSINRVLVQSNTVGTARTITAATVVISGIVDFMDITGAGAATWTVAGTGATALGDCGGNSGITFTTPATQTWSGTAGGNWSANAWTSRVPLPQDNVVINAAFSASQTVTADMPRLGASIDWTGTTGNPAWSFSSNTIFGSITMVAGMTTAGSGTVVFAGRGTFTLTSNGVDNARDISIIAPGGTYTLQDAFSASLKTLTLTLGTFNANNFNVTLAIFSSTTTGTRVLTMGSGTWSFGITAVGSFWNTATTTGLTFSGASATTVLSAASVNSRTFSGGGLTYGTLTYTVAGSTGALVITGANTFSTINFSDITNARTLTFPISTTTTITGSFNVNGTAGKLMTVNSSTGGTAATLSKSSGTVSSDYLSIQDSTATGGASWYAGANSTDVSGNTGWVFTAPPAGGVVPQAGGSSLSSLGNLASVGSF